MESGIDFIATKGVVIMKRSSIVTDGVHTTKSHQLLQVSPGFGNNSCFVSLVYVFMLVISIP